ncbi:fructose-bisphosphate aldolase-like [Diprion similis]|uniref:fructose-bisphosphate aldolase-like n=1 Tax=Diprion similis TaxID=362088 RepID=UPI001EF803C4|nr:fructose-bisphosphate aldolase-like [Diprion similis]
MARMGGKCCCKDKVCIPTYCAVVSYVKPSTIAASKIIEYYVSLNNRTSFFDCTTLHNNIKDQLKRKLIKFKMKMMDDNRSISNITVAAVYTKPDAALRSELKRIAQALTVAGKGILAADESPNSLTERFREMNLDNTETLRRDFRLMLFSADKDQISKYISGVLLHHETLHQDTPDGVDFTEFLRQRNIITGIKVDKGLVEMFGSDGETTTQGLDDLLERCIDYKKKGCHFAKWRSTYRVTDTLPSRQAIEANAHFLARYASICQSSRLVPILEPEVLTIGGHSLARSQQVHEEILSFLYRTLIMHQVYLEGTILKPSMVTPGVDNGDICSPQLIAEATLTALTRTVPSAVPAITFLSGGQSDDESTINLNAINFLKRENKPWILTFCYGRALQESAMKVWNGQPWLVEKAQAKFLERAKACSEAALGEYKENVDCGETAACQYPIE